MRRRAIALTAFAAATLTPTGPAFAENDVQYWLTLVAQADVDHNDAIYANAIFRSQPDEFDMGQRKLRLGLNHKFKDGDGVAVAYTHVRFYNDNAADVVQHRFTQAYMFPVGSLADGKVDGRIQAEQIFQEHASEMGLRGRARVRWIKPVDADKNIELTLSEELFWALNTTDWGLESGFNSNRAGATLRFKLNDHFGIAPQYIWQIAHRSNREDRNDHVLGIVLDAKF